MSSFFQRIFEYRNSPIFTMVPYGESQKNLLGYGCKFEIKIEYNINNDSIKFFFKEYSKNINGMNYSFRKLKKEIKAIILHSSHESHKINVFQPISQEKIALPQKKIVSSILKIQEHMKKGDCYLANLTHMQQLLQTYPFTSDIFLEKWFLRQPLFGFFFHHDNMGLMCFSPERFLFKKGNKIATQPIKGTQKIDSSNPSLWKKRKEMHEHTMVVDLLRHDLNTVCIPGTVHVHNPFYLKKTSHMLQMESTIVGELSKEKSEKEILPQILPAGSISGTPKKITCELIHTYEKSERGYYTGIAGIIEKPFAKKSGKDFDFAVLIRSIFKENSRIYAGVGAGITTLSNAQSEYEEFCLKLDSFL